MQKDNGLINHRHSTIYGKNGIVNRKNSNKIKKCDSKEATFIL